MKRDRGASPVQEQRTLSAFEQALVVAYRAWQERERLRGADSRPSASWLVREALRAAGSAPEALEVLRLRLQATNAADRYPTALAFLKTAARWVANGGCQAIPRNIRHLAYLPEFAWLMTSADALERELVLLDASGPLLFALAVEDAYRQSPDAFGPEDPDALAARQAAAEASWSEARARLEEALGPEEWVLLADYNPDVPTPLGLRLSAGDVVIGHLDPLAPVAPNSRWNVTGGVIVLESDWAERVCSWLATRPDVRQGLGLPA
jgi:hypothetical protein